MEWLAIFGTKAFGDWPVFCLNPFWGEAVSTHAFSLFSRQREG